MSGARGTNVVPMNQAAAPASYPAQLPFPYPGMGGFPAGCCPPGGMDALMQCYCDIQAAKNFIGKIVLDLMQTDPAFAQAMVDAIAASGAALPITGVTNGSDAQPGQVGEWVQMEPTFPLATGANSGLATIGTLGPGDWDCWMFGFSSAGFTSFTFTQAATPTQFSSGMSAWSNDAGTTNATISSTVVRCTTSVPVLIATNWDITTTGAGTLWLIFSARRMR